MFSQYWIATWIGGGQAGWFSFDLCGGEQSFPVTHEFWQAVIDQMGKRAAIQVNLVIPTTHSH